MLNAGVSSYAPSVYYEKLKYFLDAGLTFDEAVVYIDISDIHDEGILYSYDKNGALQMGLFQPAQRIVRRCRARRCRDPGEEMVGESLLYRGILGQMRYSAQLGRAIGQASFEDFAKSGGV